MPATNTLLSSAARTSSGTGSTIDTGIPQATTILAVLNVTASSGTLPTLDVFIQRQLPDGSFEDLLAFSEMVATGKRVAVKSWDLTSAEGLVQDAQMTLGSAKPGPIPGMLRVRWAIGGVTPSFTFSVIVDLY